MSQNTDHKPSKLPEIINAVSSEFFNLLRHFDPNFNGEDLAFDNKNAIDRKGAFLGLNGDQNRLAYIPIARLNRFNLPSAIPNSLPIFWELSDPYNVGSRELRSSFAVQTTVRRALTATGVIIPESMIVKLEQHFNTPNISISHISEGIAAIYALPKPDGGSLGSSCMQGCNKGWFEIYDNEPAIGCLVAKDKEGQLVGRAITWKVDSGVTCCDRRYGTSSYIEEAIAAYAQKNGMYYKSNNNMDTPESWICNGLTLSSVCQTVTLKQEEYHHYPYMDTFKYLNTYNGELNCFNDSNHDAELTSTGGYHNNLGYCERCDTHYPSDRIRYIDHMDVCDYCFDEYYTSCDQCDEDVHRDKITPVQGDCYICQDCLDNDYVCCDECNNYVHTDEIYRFDCGDICPKCIEGAHP
ncbi:MAG: hypothetical protein O2809_08895 [Proteobacteria bacterium]|nr:hypothetical protein [Pseudomonadota bacterium]